MKFLTFEQLINYLKTWKSPEDQRAVLSTISEESLDKLILKNPDIASVKRISHLLPKHKQWQFGIREYFEHKENLYFMTTTYTQPRNLSNSAESCDNFYKHFYTKHFLPHIMNTRDYHKLKEFQPTLNAFLEKNHKTRKQSENAPQPTYQRNERSARYHHHAVLSVPSTSPALPAIQDLLGENTLIRFNTSQMLLDTGFKIETSDLQTCNSLVTSYASKSIKYFPDYLSFPDKRT